MQSGPADLVPDYSCLVAEYGDSLPFDQREVFAELLVSEDDSAAVFCSQTRHRKKDGGGENHGLPKSLYHVMCQIDLCSVFSAFLAGFLVASVFSVVIVSATSSVLRRIFSHSSSFVSSSSFIFEEVVALTKVVFLTSRLSVLTLLPLLIPIVLIDG